MHALIVVPFYFFSALATFLTLAILCRLVRAPIGANTLATTAVVVAVAVVAVPLALDWIDIPHLRLPLLGLLIAITFGLAAFDVLLQRLLPIPADRELAAL